MITLLGTILFATILYIGSLDGRSGLGPFGKYTSASPTAERPWPGAERRKGDGDRPLPG